MKKSFHRTNSFQPPPNSPNSYYRPKLPPNQRGPLPLPHIHNHQPSVAKPPPVSRSNFIIRIRFESKAGPKPVFEDLISKLNLCHQHHAVSPTGVSLYFGQWVDTLNAMVSLWQSRLNGAHNLTPKLVANVVVASDKDELEKRLKLLFGDHVKGLMEGELVKKWQKKKDDKLDEIAGVKAKMNNRNCLSVFNELNEKKKVLMQERDLIVKRVREFKSAMRCVLKYIGYQNVEEETGEVGVDLFRFEDGHPDWGRIHAFILRECKRLEDGLPIYVYRQEILRRINGEQVFV